MNMNTGIISAVIGVGGVIVGVLMGSLLSGLGHLLRAKSEAKIVINKNIFNLFQIWHIITIFEKIEIENFTKLYIDKIRAHTSDEIFPQDQDENIRKLCAHFLTQFINSFLQKIDLPFKEYFYKDVMELSRFSPIFAYELSNNRYINEVLNHFEVFYNSIYQQNSTENQSSNEKQFLNDLHKGLMASKEWVTKDFSKDLQKDILKLSFKSGIKTWISSKLKIRKRQTKLMDDTKIDKYLDTYIQEAVLPLIENSKPMAKG